VTELPGALLNDHSPYDPGIIRVADTNGDIEYKVAIGNSVDPEAVDKVITDFALNSPWLIT